MQTHSEHLTQVRGSYVGKKPLCSAGGIRRAAFLEEEVSGLGRGGRFSGRGIGEQKAEEAQRRCGLHVGCRICDVI